MPALQPCRVEKGQNMMENSLKFLTITQTYKFIREELKSELPEKA